MNKKGWLVVAGVAVLLGGYVYRTYPRHVAMTLHGVQYRLGSHGRGLQQVTLTLNGTRDQPIFGPETFYGTVDISGATFPDHGNGQLIKLQFVSGVGGLLAYLDSATQQFYYYGALYPNRSFTQFAVTEWQQGGSGGWSGGNGLLIAAPAKSRSEVLRMSNTLMTSWSALLPGHPLK